MDVIQMWLKDIQLHGFPSFSAEDHDALRLAPAPGISGLNEITAMSAGFLLGLSWARFKVAQHGVQPPAEEVTTSEA